jgi:hypothetical protein
MNLMKQEAMTSQSRLFQSLWASLSRRLFSSRVISILIVTALVLVCVPAQAYTIRQVRSLNAVAATANGFSFTNPPSGILPISPPGGGVTWTILLSGSAPTLTVVIQAQMTDQTWVTISAPAAYAGTIPTQYFSFFGPFIDVRVVVTAYTSGTITADEFVEF